jgi:type IV secretion system protein VirD4
VRLILNQIGRRLTEDLSAQQHRHRLLLMLDEFPALGRLDFFESALAFMAGYGMKSFLIAQSLNQIEKAYGPNHSILDNCHVRVSFATNDERTARRVSDALGTTTEQRAMKNYAGHRLSPWLAHLMVSRQETARALLTPGEIMQLPPDDELLMISGSAPIRAKKARYFEDPRFRERIYPPATRTYLAGDRPTPDDDWHTFPLSSSPSSKEQGGEDPDRSHDSATGGVRREPELSEHEQIARECDRPMSEFDFTDDETDNEIQPAGTLMKRAADNARQAAMDPDDGLGLGD